MIIIAGHSFFAGDVPLLYIGVTNLVMAHFMQGGDQFASSSFRVLGAKILSQKSNANPLIKSKSQIKN